MKQLTGKGLGCILFYSERVQSWGTNGVFKR